MLQLIDNYAAPYSLLIIGLFECTTIAYIYGTKLHDCTYMPCRVSVTHSLIGVFVVGIENFFKDIEMMLGRRPGLWWWIVWKYVTPVLLTVRCTSERDVTTCCYSRLNGSLFTSCAHRSGRHDLHLGGLHPQRVQRLRVSGVGGRSWVDDDDEFGCRHPYRCLLQNLHHFEGRNVA